VPFKGKMWKYIVQADRLQMTYMAHALCMLDMDDFKFILTQMTLSLSVETMDVHNRHAFCFCDTRTELLNIILMIFSI
jgi:hypothetical protein